jgi:hypothetical protein
VLFPLASPARFSRSVREPGRASRNHVTVPRSGRGLALAARRPARTTYSCWRGEAAWAAPYRRSGHGIQQHRRDYQFAEACRIAGSAFHVLDDSRSVCLVRRRQRLPASTYLRKASAIFLKSEIVLGCSWGTACRSRRQHAPSRSDQGAESRRWRRLAPSRPGHVASRGRRHRGRWRCPHFGDGGWGGRRTPAPDFRGMQRRRWSTLPTRTSRLPV